MLEGEALPAYSKLPANQGARWLDVAAANQDASFKLSQPIRAWELPFSLVFFMFIPESPLLPQSLVLPG